MVPIYFNGTQTAKSFMQHFNNVKKYARLYTHHCYLLQSIRKKKKNQLDLKGSYHKNVNKKERSD